MKLGDFLKVHQISQAKFAVWLKSDQGHVSDLVRGKVRPKLTTVAEVSRLTEGEVTWLDWADSKPKAKGKKR